MKRFTCGFLVVAVLCAPAVFAEGVFKVGFAKIDVTPQAPVPMWGYGARKDLLSIGTRDPLYAKALVIETDNGTAALVGLDLGRSPGDPEFTRISEAVKTQAGVDHIMMSGSHTHHGPVMELLDEPDKGQGKFQAAVDYRGELEEKLIKVIVEAASDMQDARIGWNSKDVDMNRNRQAQVEPKPRDTELSVVRFDDTSGDPIAVLVNFTAHPTMLAGGDLRFSAEYPGVMMNTVEAALDTNVFFMQGAAGDMSVQTSAEDNVPRDDPSLDPAKMSEDVRKRIMEVQEKSEEDALKEQIEMAKRDGRMVNYGKRLGAEVIELVNGTETAVPEKPSVQGETQVFEFESRVNFQSPMVVAMFQQGFFPELANASLTEVDDNIIETRLTVLLINGELALVGGSGEFFSDHANMIKARSHAAKTLFIGYCNGHNMYFPTIQGAAQGGYGADPTVSWVSIGAGERMMNEALITIFEFLGQFQGEPLGG